MLGAFILLGMVLICTVLWVRAECLPHWVRRGLAALPGVAPLYAQRGGPSTAALQKQIAYNIDTWFSTNPSSQTIALLGLTAGMVVLGALGIKAVSGQSMHSAVWEAIAGVGIDWSFASATEDFTGVMGFLARVVALLISTGGLLITALLLGIVSETIGARLEDLRKGKSEVLERGHSLILGYSEKIVVLVDQLCQANQSEGGRTIVVLADRPKEGMEEQLARHAVRLRGSRVVFRQGSPLVEGDLRRVSVASARAIIVLSTGDDADQADARVLRTVLALVGEHDRLQRHGGEGLCGHIVAELADIDNEPLVRLAGGEGICTVTSHDIIGRLMVQSARQPGLAAVWEQIMGFKGDEFYMREWPGLVGRTFADILLMFEDAVPLGVKSPGQQVMLNPSGNYVFTPGDQLLVLAEDDDTYRPLQKPAAVIAGKCPNWTQTQRREKLLFIGWRRDLDDLIDALDAFVPQGSELHLYSEVPIQDRDRLLLDGGMDVANLRNLKLVYKDPVLQGEMTCRRRLEELCPEDFTSILVLSDPTTLGVLDSDSRCIAVSLLLRDIQASRMVRALLKEQATHRAATAKELKEDTISVPDRGKSTAQHSPPRKHEQRAVKRRSTLEEVAEAAVAGALSRGGGGVAGELARRASNDGLMRRLRGARTSTAIIAEILDSRAKRIVADLRLAEYVLSNELVSMALAMVAENPEVNTILAELFTAPGNELYVVPAAKYLHPDDELSFYDVISRAHEGGELIMGFVRKEEHGEVHPILNPKGKSRRNLTRDLVASFIVLAEEPPGLR